MKSLRILSVLLAALFVCSSGRRGAGEGGQAARQAACWPASIQSVSVPDPDG